MHGIKKGYPVWVLVLIFLVVLGTRFFFAFQTPTFTGSEAYFNLYQTDSIKETLTPVVYDDLSYSGRTHIFSPLYHYILAFFSFIFGTVFVLKTLPNIFISFLVFIVYAIARKITHNKNISLLTAAFAGFIPIVFLETTNTVSIYSLTVPLMFLALLFFMNAKEKKIYSYYFSATIFALALLSPIAFLLVIGFLIYLLLVKLEYKKGNRIETELIMFATFFILWLEFIIYKKAFLYHGLSLIWQNIPQQIIASFFKELTVIEVLYGVGIIPLLFGIYTIYRFTLKDKDRNVYLLVSFALAVFFLLWFQLMDLRYGLVFLGVILVLLFSRSAKTAFNYLEKTRFSWSKMAVAILLIALFLLTAFIPSLINASKSVGSAVSPQEIEALTWIRENTEKDSVILSTVEEGQFIVSIAQRRNVADLDFILVKDPHLVLDDIKIMYTSLFKTRGIKLLTDYGVDYIYFSPKAKELFEIEEIRYIGDVCFDIVFDNGIKIYESLCRVDEE